MTNRQSIKNTCLSFTLLLGAAACGELSADVAPSPEEGQLDQLASKRAEPGKPGESGPGTSVTGDFQHRARRLYATALTGDFNGDGKTDAMVAVPEAVPFGAPNISEVWTGFSDGNGNLSVYKVRNSIADYAGPKTSPIVVGDFNGDGKDDLYRHVTVMWGPSDYTFHVLGLSDGLGRYVEQQTLDMPWDFTSHEIASGARLLACDINGDGKDDLVATGGAGWFTIPVAFSNGNNSFTFTNYATPYFPTWTQDQNAKLACDDFNGDGKDDLTILGGAGWFTIPVAFSNGDGSFTVTNASSPNLPAWSQEPGVQLVTGDVDGDHRADLMITGRAGWTTIPLGISRGDGTFLSLNPSVYNLGAWADDPQSLARGGDFNGDGLADLTLLGGDNYWYTLPIGISTGSYGFTTWNQPVP